VRNFGLRERRNAGQRAVHARRTKSWPNSGVMSCLGAAHTRRGAWQ
jgi:hypothetical protein